jgi:diguanylate cyclase (GGDEF)-like protein
MLADNPSDPGFDAVDNAEKLLDLFHRRERELLRLAATDPLTGLANRRAFFEALETEVARSRRYGRPLALLMADVDGLKAANDSGGHVAGDKLLAALASILRDGVRGVDLPARYGGDEFIVLMPETTLEGAAVAAERLRAAVAAQSFDDGVALTVSIGVAATPPVEADGDRLVAEADAALYRAKNAGGNAIALTSPR